MKHSYSRIRDSRHGVTPLIVGSVVGSPLEARPVVGSNRGRRLSRGLTFSASFWAEAAKGDS